MDLGYDQPLYILAFDHRGSFQKKMLGHRGRLRLPRTASGSPTPSA